MDPFFLVARPSPFTAYQLNAYYMPLPITCWQLPAQFSLFFCIRLVARPIAARSSRLVLAVCWVQLTSWNSLSCRSMKAVRHCLQHLPLYVHSSWLDSKTLFLATRGSLYDSYYLLITNRLSWFCSYSYLFSNCCPVLFSCNLLANRFYLLSICCLLLFDTGCCYLKGAACSSAFLLARW